MNLLVDLSSKLKYKSASVGEGRRTDVPPDLKRVVSSSTKKEATKKRILILSVLVLLAIVAGAIVAGVGTVYLMELYIKPSDIKIVRSQESGVISRQTEVEADNSNTEDNKSVIARSNNDEAIQKGEIALPSARNDKPKPPAIGNSAVSKPKVVKYKATKKIHQQKKVPESKIEEEKIAEAQGPKPKAEPKAENFQKDVEKKPAIAQEQQLKPQDSQKDVYLYTARTYESKKDYHQALLNYKKAMEIDPGNYIIMNNISSVLIHLNLLEEAIKYAKNVLALKKDYVPSLINIGIAYIRLNNPTEGEAYLSKALSIEPSNSYALLNLGLLYEKRGDNDRAYGYFYKLSEVGNIQGHLGIARIVEKQGRISDAVRIYKKILSMNNIDPGTRKLVNERLLLLGQ